MSDNEINIFKKVLKYSGQIQFNFNEKQSIFKISQFESVYVKLWCIITFTMFIITISIFITQFRFVIGKGEFEKAILISIYSMYIVYGILIMYQILFQPRTSVKLANQVLKIHKTLCIKDCKKLWNRCSKFIIIRVILIPGIVFTMSSWFLLTTGSYIPTALIFVKCFANIYQASIVPASLIILYMTFLLEYVSHEIETIENHQQISFFSFVYSESVKIFNKIIYFNRFNIFLHEYIMFLSFLYELYSTCNIIFFRISIIPGEIDVGLIMFRLNNFSFSIINLISFAVIIKKLLEANNKLVSVLHTLEVTVAKSDNQMRRKVNPFV